MDSLFIWFLITVLPSGQVGDAKGFPTKAVCEEARSAAEYGMSVDSVIWHNRKAVAERDTIKRHWDSVQAFKEAPRKPKTKKDSALVRGMIAGKSILSFGCTGTGGGWGQIVWNNGYDYADTSGMIRYRWCGRYNQWSGPEDLKPQLKYSACVRK